MSTHSQITNLCRYCGEHHEAHTICQRMFLAHSEPFVRLSQENPMTASSPDTPHDELKDAWNAMAAAIGQELQEGNRAWKFIDAVADILQKRRDQARLSERALKVESSPADMLAALRYLHDSTAPQGQWADQAVHGFVGAMLKTAPVAPTRGDLEQTISLALLQLDMPKKFREGAAHETLASALKNDAPQDASRTTAATVAAPEVSEMASRSPAAASSVSPAKKEVGPHWRDGVTDEPAAAAPQMVGVRVTSEYTGAATIGATPKGNADLIGKLRAECERQKSIHQIRGADLMVWYSLMKTAADALERNSERSQP